MTRSPAFLTQSLPKTQEHRPNKKSHPAPGGPTAPFISISSSHLSSSCLRVSSCPSRLPSLHGRQLWSRQLRSCIGRVSSCHTRGRLRSEEHTSELQSLRHLVC